MKIHFSSGQLYIVDEDPFFIDYNDYNLFFRDVIDTGACRIFSFESSAGPVAASCLP